MFRLAKGSADQRAESNKEANNITVITGIVYFCVESRTAFFSGLIVDELGVGSFDTGLCKQYFDTIKPQW